MKKIILSAVFASFILAGTVSANWITGESTILAVSQGEAAFHTTLSSDQRLDAGMTSGESVNADVIFSTASSTEKLTITCPVRQSSGTSADGTSYTDAKLTVTPLINTDSGRRFYLVETGTAGGSQIVAYKKGIFTVVFAADSLKTDFDEVSFQAAKKELLLHTVTNGAAADYILKFDNKTGTFNATLKA